MALTIAIQLLHAVPINVNGYLLFLIYKKEYMCYNQTGDISTLDGTSLKLVDKFSYLGSSISSTEKDIDTRLMKAWIALDHMDIRPDR